MSRLFLIDRASFESHVARRVFLLFLVCALVPLASTFLLSARFTARELRSHAEDQLRRLSKTQALTTSERLWILDDQLAVVAAAGEKVRTLERAPGEDWLRGFSNVWIAGAEGSLVLRGQPVEDVVLEPSQMREIAVGQSVLEAAVGSGAPRLLLARALDDGAVIWAEVDLPRLWWGPGRESTLPPATEMMVTDAEGRVLQSTFAAAPEVSGRLLESADSAVGTIELEQAGHPYFGRYWKVPLRTFVGSPSLTFLVAVPTDSLASSLPEFRRTLAGVGVVSLCLILLLSLIQIRRTLTPLTGLGVAAGRIAGGDLAARVAIATGDEFEQLGDSFNLMGRRLERQFEALATRNEIDRAVLSSLSTREILDVILARVGDLVPCDFAAISLVERSGGLRLVTLVRDSQRDGVEPFETPLERHELFELGRWLRAHSLGQGIPAPLAALRAGDLSSSSVAPILLRDELGGVLVVGLRREEAHTADEVQQILALADQVAVAVANARLVERLDIQHRDTLAALARAVDLKSRWTHGHSARVATLARQLGGRVGLSTAELDVLYRGGLVHDIGKIGIPNEVLDKPASLSVDEVETLRSHVRLGAEILAPIASYQDVMPILWEHHEWFNGQGYPFGLVRGEISLHGRLVAIVDVFDAMTSPRPYRPALNRDEVLVHMRSLSGTQFDPSLLAVFLQMADDGEVDVVHAAASDVGGVATGDVSSARRASVAEGRS